MGNHLSGARSHVTEILLLSCLCFITVLARGDRPVCDIPPVESNGTAFISCYLPEEISEAKLGFTVSRHDSNGRSVSVMQAAWTENGYAIHLSPGYVSDGSSDKTRIFKFHIRHVNESHAGKYSCKPDGYNDSDVQSCQLILSQNDVLPAKLETRKSKDVYCNASAEGPFHIIFMCVNVICAIFLVCVFVIFAKKIKPFRNWIRNLFPCRNAGPRRSNGERTEEQIEINDSNARID